MGAGHHGGMVDERTTLFVVHKGWGQEGSRKEGQLRGASPATATSPAH